MTGRARAWALATTIASLFVATFLIWDVVDEDSFPHALLIPLLIAAIIALTDAIARIINERRSDDPS